MLKTLKLDSEQIITVFTLEQRQKQTEITNEH